MSQPVKTTDMENIKESAFGNYQKWSDRRLAWKDGIAKAATLKALDLTEEDGVIIDASKREEHFHHHEAPFQTPTKSPTGSLAKSLLGAGLLAAGIGAPIGGYLIAQSLLKPAVKEIVHDPGKVFQGDANVNVGKATVQEPQE